MNFNAIGLSGQPQPTEGPLGLDHPFLRKLIKALHWRQF